MNDDAESYVESAQFTDVGARAKAERLGCTIEYSDDYTLQLDLDSEDAHTFFLQQLDMLEDIGGLADIGEWAKRSSRSGNYHVTLKLIEPLSVEKRILLQALLGSDRKREMLAYAGLLRGQANSVLLFRPKVKED